MNEPNKYVVVVFKRENKVDVVPITWTFVKDTAMYSYWPRLKSIEEVHLAARDEDPPNKRTWLKYQIRVLKEFASYQRAVDSVEHFMVNSDYQESESSLQHSFDSTPVSHLAKTRTVNTIARNLNEELDFVAPKPPQELLNSALVPPRGSKPSTLCRQGATSSMQSGSHVALDVRSDTSLSEDLLTSELQGVPTHHEIDYSHGLAQLENLTPEVDDVLDISKSYVTMDVHQLVPTKVHCEGQCDDFWNNYKRFHSNILNAVEKVSSSQALLNKRIDDIAAKLDNLKLGHERDQPSFGFRSQLPFKTTEDLVAFSDSLKSDEGKRKAIVKFLGAIGGKEVSDSCNNILKRLLTDDVAMTFSYLGTTSKLNFESLEINSVIFDAIQSNKQLGATEKAIRDRVMQFLHHAKDRLKSRGQSTNKKSQENEEPRSSGT